MYFKLDDKLSLVKELEDNLEKEKYKTIVPDTMTEEAQILIGKLYGVLAEYHSTLSKIEELRAELKKERAVVLKDQSDPSRFIGKVLSGKRKGMIVLFSPEMQRYLQENGAEPGVTQVILDDYRLSWPRDGKIYIECSKCHIPRSRSDIEKEIQDLEWKIDQIIKVLLFETLSAIEDRYSVFEAAYEAYTKYGIHLIKLGDFIRYNVDEVIDGREKSVKEIYMNPDVKKILLLPTDERAHVIELLNIVLRKVYEICCTYTPKNHKYYVWIGDVAYSATHLIIPLHLQCEEPINNICPCGDLCDFIEERIGKIEEIPSYHIPTLGITSNPIAVVKPYRKLTTDQIIRVNIFLAETYTTTPSIMQLDLLDHRLEKLEHEQEANNERRKRRDRTRRTGIFSRPLWLGTEA